MSARVQSRFPFGGSVRRGGRGIGLLFAVALGLFGWLSAVAQAAVPGSVPSSTWVANGQVDSVLPASKLVYIGGSFKYVGPNTGGGVPLSLKRGSAVARFPKVNGMLCVCGPSGTGKSHLIEALGHLAIDKGRTVAWHTPETLAQLLRRHRVDDSVNKAIGKLIRVDLVVIDDVGLLPISADAAEALFRVVDAAYEKRSIAISSNIHPSGLTS
jgi:IstB-like ATP binding protein